MEESGQLEKLWNKWKPKVDANCRPNQTKPIGFVPILSAFGILILSMGFSLLIFLAEKTLYIYL